MTEAPVFQVVQQVNWTVQDISDNMKAVCKGYFFGFTGVVLVEAALKPWLSFM